MAGLSPWAAGDYRPTAARLAGVAEDLVAGLGDVAGRRVLDVGAGTGNAALAAARRGAIAVGLDPTRELLDEARARAESEGLACEWVEGAAEALPFPDDSFDAVVSVFGVMFAPDHEAAAAELVRVCRAGGTVSVANWIPDGPLAGFAGAVASVFPPPPAGTPSPAAWGREHHVRDLFAAAGAEARFERGEVVFEARSVEAYVDAEMESNGMLVTAASTLEAGERAALRSRLVAILDEGNEAQDGSFRATSRYLAGRIGPR